LPSARSAVAPLQQQLLSASESVSDGSSQSLHPPRVVSPAGLSPALQAQYQAQAAAQPAWLQAQHQAVLEQQQALLAEAAKAKAALKAANARQQHGAAVAAGAGSGYVSLSDRDRSVSAAAAAAGAPLHVRQRSSGTGDYSGMGSSSAPPVNMTAQQTPPRRFVPAPTAAASASPYPSLYDSYGDEAAMAQAQPYVALTDESPIQTRDHRQQQQQQQQQQHQIAPSFAASAPSPPPPLPSVSESKEDSEAAAAAADAAYAEQMARRLEALEVSEDGSLNASPPPVASNRPAKVKHAGDKDKALPLLANLL